MKLNIAICDDEPNAGYHLSKIIENYSFSKGVDFQIDYFSDGKALLQRYQKSGDYHILLLDVEMPGLNGIRLAEIIRTTIDKRMIIVFISNYPQYMQDSFRVHPFHYITKPVTMNSVYDLMNHVIDEIEDRHVIYSLINSDLGEITINIKDILYIEVTDSKLGLLKFHFHDNSITTKGTLGYWNNELKNYNFYQCHRSILLNLAHIHYFIKHAIILDNGQQIPVSRASEKYLKDSYLNHTMKLINL